MTMRAFTKQSVCLLLGVCALPPVYGLWDATVVPKWYACGWLLLAMGVVFLWKSYRPRKNDFLKGVRMGACLFAVIEFCFVAYECMAFPQRVLTVGAKGTYDNPAALALCLCIFLPFLCPRRQMQRRTRLLLGMLSFLCLSMLIASQSRTGMLAVTFMLLVFLLRHLCWNTFYKTTLLFVSVLAVSFFVFARKTDSTLGRLFILQRTWEIVDQQPVFGAGPFGFSRTYMNCQAAYFRQHPNSSSALLADEVRHPLNEFLLVWVDYGLLGLLLLVGVFVLALKSAWSITLFYSLLALLLFSLFSYPFHQPLSWLVLGTPFVKGFDAVHVPNPLRYGCFFLFVILLGLLTYRFVLEIQWSSAALKSLHGQSRAMMPEYERLRPHFNHHPYFLYNYAAEQYQADEFEQARRTLNECGRYLSGYNVELLSGDICRRLREYDAAQAHYLQAHYMCPSRFAPLEGMLHVYMQQGDTLSACSVASMIRCQQMKVPSSDVLRIKREAESMNTVHIKQ